MKVVYTSFLFLRTSLTKSKHKFIIFAPECYLNLMENDILVGDKQVTASFMSSPNMNPANVLPGKTGLHWSPPLRTGAGWENWLQFDFKATARITGMDIVYTANSRLMDKILVQASNAPLTYWDVKETAEVSMTFSPAVKARYTRILFHKPVAAEQDTKYIEVAR